MSVWYTEDDDKVSCTSSNYTTARPALEDRIKDKIISLQNELILHAYDGKTRLNDNDVIRYSAMVEVLKAVLQ